MITVNFKCIKGNDITKERVLAGFSPCFVEWYDSSIVGSQVGKLTASVVGGGTHTFENLIPNADGKFYFDLSMIAKPYLLMCKPWRAKRFEWGYTAATVNDESGLMTFGDIVDIEFRFFINTTQTLNTYPISFSRAVMQFDQVNRASLVDYVGFVDSDEEDPNNLSVLLHSKNINRWSGYPLDVSFMIAKPAQTGNYLPFGVKLYGEGLELMTSGIIGNTNKYSQIVSYCLDHLTDGFTNLSLHAIGSFSGGLEMYNVYDFKMYHKDSECGYYIRWRNNLGGWSYWLFDGNAAKNTQVSERNNMLDVFTTDPYMESSKKMLQRQIVKQTIVTTTTEQEFENLHLSDLNTSTEVYLYTLPRGSVPQGKPEEWKPIKIVAFNSDPATERTPVKTYRVTFEDIETLTVLC